MTHAVPPRLAPLPLDQWSEREREVLRGHLASADRYLSGRPDGPPMPPILGLLARNAGIGGPWLAFSAALIQDGSLPGRDRELLILRVAVRTGCGYLLSEHSRLGATMGLSPEELDAVADGPLSALEESDRLLMRAVDDLVDSHTVSQPTWDRLSGRFEERRLMEILFLIGSYVCLAMVLNSVGLQPQSKES